MSPFWPLSLIILSPKAGNPIPLSLLGVEKEHYIDQNGVQPLSRTGYEIMRVIIEKES